MDDENQSSKSAVPKSSNPEEDKNSSKIENSSVHNDDDGVIDGSSGAESLQESKVEALISETLAHPTIQIETDSQSEFDTEFAPSYQLSEVPVEYEMPPFGFSKKIKDRISVTRTGTLNAQARTEHLRDVPDEASSLELSSISVSQSTSSVPSPILAERRLSAVVNCSTGEVANQSSDAKGLPLVPVLKTTTRDGYNWRKYGQKSQHNHDPPPRVNCSRESKSAALTAPTNGKSIIAHPNRNSNETMASSLKENLLESLPIAETANQDSGGSDTDTEITIKEEHSNEPEQKKRSRKSDASCSESDPKPGKKPKLVVHAACDVGISSDGYMWRKYGQKIVKGNPHPRNAVH